MSAPERDGDRFAKLAERLDAQDRPEPRNAGRQAIDEILSASGLLLEAARRLNRCDQASVDHPGEGEGAGTHAQYPTREAARAERGRRRHHAWIFLIVGERIHALVGLCRAILEWLLH